jgi:hypothetical protein
MWVGFALNVFANLEPKCFGTTAYIVPMDNSVLVQIMSILMVPSYIYFEMMLTVVTAAGVGGWYFQGQNTPSNPSIVGLKWAYGSSSGPIFLATIITWPIVEVRKFINSKWLKLSLLPVLPILWPTLAILWCFCLRPFLAFSKFMLIAHTFHGGDAFSVAKTAWKVLKKHLGGAVVTDSVACFVLHGCVTALSVSFAIATWAWMESAVGAGILAELFAGKSENMTVVIILIVLIAWFCNHSLLTIVLVALLSGILKGEFFKGIHGFLVGIFVGAIANIIFCFLAQVMHAGMDTIFYCFALEADNAKAQSREGFAELTDMIEKNIVKPLPAYLNKTQDADDDGLAKP